MTERPPPGRTRGYALSEIPIVRRALRSRWPQFGLTAIMLAFFVLAIVAGLAGTPAGNRNFGIVFVWIVWWALLILLLVPFAGRMWCGVCPIPAPGEWLQRRALVQPRPGGKLYTLGLKWPRPLRNIWLQNAGFLGVALFSAVILTTPAATALVLLAFMIVAVGTSLAFERRTFCRYLCPVGGFIGLYSQVAPLELRVKDPAVCAGHKEKTCYTGSDDGYGCPWMVFPGSLTSNTYCGLCTECLRTCNRDNVAIFARRAGADLLQTSGRRLDEAYKGLIMLACAFIYSAVLLGPWGELKEAARAVGTPGWMAYTAAFLAINLVVVPGLFWIAVRAGRWLGGREGETSSSQIERLATQAPPAMAGATLPNFRVGAIASSLRAESGTVSAGRSEGIPPVEARGEIASSQTPLLATTVPSLGGALLATTAVNGSARVTARGTRPGRPAVRGMSASTSELFAGYAAVLVPLGLAAWVAFTLSFVLINFSYAWPALSDPLGWGWDLLGTASLPWTPYAPGLVPLLQVPVLLAGLASAIALALRTAGQHGQRPWGALPVAAFCTASTIGLLGLYLA